MFKRISGAILMAAALTMASNLYAGPLNVKTGLWKTTTTATRNGQTMPPRTRTRCVTQKDLDDLSKIFTENRLGQNGECKRSDFSQSRNSLHWKYECSGQFQIVSVGDMKFEGATRYTGTVTTSGNIMGHEMNNEMKMVGERIGDCTGNENAQ